MQGRGPRGRNPVDIYSTVKKLLLCQLFPSCVLFGNKSYTYIPRLRFGMIVADT